MDKIKTERLMLLWDIQHIMEDDGTTDYEKFDEINALLDKQSNLLIGEIEDEEYITTVLYQEEHAV